MLFSEAAAVSAAWRLGVSYRMQITLRLVTSRSIHEILHPKLQTQVRTSEMEDPFSHPTTHCKFPTMGIPQFKRHLEPYGERCALKQGKVVVDGPALAYHILNLCSRTTRKTSPFEQPSYDLLGRTAIAWLDHIQACGLSV